jgi:hypothetical protein
LNSPNKARHATGRNPKAKRAITKQAINSV